MMQRVVPGSLVAGNASAPVGDVVKKLVYQVSSVSGKVATVAATSGYTNSNVPVQGDDFVRIGNTSNSNRQGSIYLTSDDSNAPFIDIKDDIDSYADWHSTSTTKARLGNLSGITHNSASLSGYGLYSQNVYLTGDITASTGQIGNWKISSGTLYVLDSGTPSATPNNGIVLDDNGGYNNKAIITVYKGTTITAAVGNFSDNKYGISAIEGDLGGWIIDSNSIHKDASSSYIGIASTAHSSSPAGTSPQFFAGATGTQGQSANIAFASNGKIYGNGIYVKESGGSSVDYLITASRIFGNGSDGDLTISSSSQTTSTWISSGSLQRDIYANNLTVNASFVSNGYRIFVRNTLTIGGSYIISNNGFSGDAGGNASGSSAGTAGYSRGSGTGTGQGAPTGSLLGGIRGADGGAGGVGAIYPSQQSTSGGSGSNYSSAQANCVKAYTNSAGARGADGTGDIDTGSSGGFQTGGTAAGTSSATAGNVSVLDADLTYVIAMRDFFSTDTTGLIPPLRPSAGSQGGAGGGGGGLSGKDDQNTGSGDGGGGQGGGGGGHGMVCARLLSGT